MRYSPAQFNTEDAKLNTLYSLTQHKSENDPDWGTINSDGIKSTQRAWIHYRDAWIEFAKIKYPNYSPDSIAAWFTKKRDHMLNSILRV